jgi:hypothetical protein
MQNVVIQQVGLDLNRRLRVRATPSRSSGYDYIYRDASGVAWDELRTELYVRDALESSPVDEFKRIVAAVAREYGDHLILEASTLFVDIPSDTIAALRESVA